MRKALVVGINEYPNHPLRGAVQDAETIAAILGRHDDGRINFATRKTVPSENCDKAILRQRIDELFQDQVDVALLYFSGHGYVNSLGGDLVAPDAKKYDAGISMDEILRMANRSKARERIIILDCCFAGQMGEYNVEESTAHIKRNFLLRLSAMH